MALAFFLLLSPLLAQKGDYIRNAETFIDQKKYASAHSILNAAIQDRGMLPALINPMIDNVLKHYFMQRDFEVFYLQDYSNSGREFNFESVYEFPIVAFRHPDRLLKKVIAAHPQFAWSYKLLGDFYDLQLCDDANRQLLPDALADDLRGKVYENYHRAVQLGYNQPDVNRWLGQYYREGKQYRIAKQFYQKNLELGVEDPETFCRLAEIYLYEKQYSQAYNSAVRGLQMYAHLEPELRYETTRTAALALLNIGEEARFVDYIFECIQLFPDHQSAYIDLLEYYESKDDWLYGQKMIRRMLFNNPYDHKGYYYLEKFCARRNDYEFADALFDEMMGRFEHFDEAMGNIYRFRGNLLFYQGKPEEAHKIWEISKSYYSRCLPPDSPLIKQVGDVRKGASIK
ncbi:MAG: hypothetical protein KDH97_15100 [Calditrichaeota bacterium]|nr:hypothetical protein [Calditrichota bacterium]MCB0305025.1 hypothetical protein [Calditrichota bacterium]MCB9089741.1 hypothetical protein [Calditrichia bacterium]